MGIKDINDSVLRNILYLLWENDVLEVQMCTDLNINKSAVTDWKTGKTASYNRYLSEIAGYFGVSALDLMSSRFIADRLLSGAGKAESGDVKDSTARLNEFHSFPRSVQEVGLDVMRGIAKRSSDGK